MENYNIETLKQFLGNFKEVGIDSWNEENIETPFEISSKEFLNFADYDLTNESNHHLVNALSNIKRAIDCHLDSLLCGFGLFDYSKKKRWSFPRKVQKLNELGLISPRILDRINKKRNLLEHEYRNSIKEEVEDAFDIATLFIACTEKFLLNAIIYFEIYHDVKKDRIQVELNYKKSEITFSETEVKNNDVITIMRKKIKFDSGEYIDYLKIFISLYKLKY